MLRKLSLRNASRQLQNYLLYFITLTLSVALIFGFNSLIFSDTVQQSFQMTALAYVTPVASGLAVLMLGWLISYMLNFMLKKRSLELGTYLLLGVEKRLISRMFLLENLIIGFFAFLCGTAAGMLVSQILISFIANLLGRTYVIQLDLSPAPIVLTFVCFFAMFLLSLGKCQRKIKHTKLSDLLYMNQQPERPALTSMFLNAILLVLSLLCFAGAVFMIRNNVLGSGADIPIAIFLVILFLYSFYSAVTAVLGSFLHNNRKWKFKKSRMLLLRLFTAKAHSISLTLGTLSGLFVIALFIMNIGILLTSTLDFRTELQPFDFTATCRVKDADFLELETLIQEQQEIDAAHTYKLYTNPSTSFYQQFSDTPTGYNYVSSTSSDADHYMKYSDYCLLRSLLGYEPAKLAEQSYLIHCLYLIESDIISGPDAPGTIQIGSATLSPAAVYTEHFDQYDGEPNGQNLLFIIPDELAEELDYLCTKYVVNFSNPFTPEDYDILMTALRSQLPVHEIRTSINTEAGYVSTRSENAVYIDSAAALRASNGEIYAIITLPLFYVAFILSITAITVLATQLLSDTVSLSQQYDLLSKLGMSRNSIDRSLFSYLSSFFLLPFIPALLISAVLSLSFAGAFGMTTFVTGSILLLHTAGATGLFILIYVIYFAAVYIMLSRSIHSSL